MRAIDIDARAASVSGRAFADSEPNILEVDFFETYGGTEALADNYDGDTGGYSITTDSARVADGSQALENDGSSTNIIYSNGNLPNTPQEGDVFRAALYIPSNAGDDHRVPSWGEMGDQADAIGLIHEVSSDTIRITRWGGSVNNADLATTSLDYSANNLLDTLFEVEVEWTGDSHIVDVYDGIIDNGASQVVSGLSATDPAARTDGEIKFLARDAISIDNYRITGGDRV